MKERWHDGMLSTHTGAQRHAFTLQIESELKEGHLIGLWRCRQVRDIRAAAQVGQRLVCYRMNLSSPILVQLDDSCISW